MSVAVQPGCAVQDPDRVSVWLQHRWLVDAATDDKPEARLCESKECTVIAHTATWSCTERVQIDALPWTWASHTQGLLAGRK